MICLPNSEQRYLKNKTNVLGTADVNLNRKRVVYVNIGGNNNLQFP